MTAPEIRPASTVMLVRDGEQGVQVFMLRRTTAAAFAGGMYVFPGGRVDATDGPAESPLAYRTAAVRECYEESGVLLATHDGALIADGHPALGHREEIHSGKLSIAQLCVRYDLELALDRLVWTQRWITPKGEVPRRFDTRFYVVGQPPAQSFASHDDSETVASMWVTADDALRQQREGNLLMLPPTIAALSFLASRPTVEDLLAHAAAIGEPPAILPKFRPGSGWQVVLPGEPGYDELD